MFHVSAGRFLFTFTPSKIPLTAAIFHADNRFTKRKIRKRKSLNTKCFLRVLLKKERKEGRKVARVLPAEIEINDMTTN